MTMRNVDILFQIELDCVKFQRLLVSDDSVSYDEYKQLYLTLNHFVKMLDTEIKKYYRSMVK